MLEHKNFIDIQRCKNNYFDVFKPFDDIYITEKLDGSNASFQYDKDTQKLCAFSRRTCLDFKNNLSGFYEYVQKLNSKDFKQYSDYRFFGEWNLNHLVKYQKGTDKKLYIFDIYDMINEKWTSQEFVNETCRKLNLDRVPIFYVGKFISWEHIQSFVGRTAFGETHGEGIVVRNETRLNDPDSKNPFILKFVSEKYKETSNAKIKSPTAILELKENYDLAQAIVTLNRIEKTLYKMIEDSIIPLNWDESNMAQIARQLPTLVYNDCIKEESEIANSINNFGKFCSQICMKIVREKLNNNSKME